MQNKPVYLADKQTTRDIISVATGKSSLKVEPTPETKKIIRNTTLILGGSLTFLALAILMRKK